MASLVLPRVHTMTICDAAQKSLVEVGVYDLAGVRSTMVAVSFPHAPPRWCMFLHMSGHRGEAICHIEVDRVETSEVIYESARKSIVFNGPWHVVPVVFRIRNCVFPAPGLYYIQVYHEAKLIGERSLRVLSEE